MKDLQQLRADIQAMQNRVREALPQIAILLCLSSKAIAERNIKDKGVGASYSKLTVPAWYFIGRELNQSGTAFIKAKEKAEEETNWGELRAAQGLQDSYVDLTYKGSMWSNMAPGQVQITDNAVFSPLAATNREAQNEMNWNFDRYGDFIFNALTPENKTLLLNLVISELYKIISSSGFILK